MINAKEVKMTWDAAAIEASLPRASAFTFMDLLAMKGLAPVAEAPTHRSIAVESATGAIRRAYLAVVGVVAELKAPAFDFMSLLDATGQVPAPALASANAGQGSGLERLLHRDPLLGVRGYANDDWKDPANRNAAPKVA